MVEVIAGLWLGSFVISLLITALNVRFAWKRSQSVSYKILNINLAKIGFYWSLSSENFVNLSEGTPDQDAQKAVKSFVMLGALGLLSVLGLVLHIIMSFSLQVLMKGRLTQDVFASPLKKDDKLSLGEVTALVEQIKFYN